MDLYSNPGKFPNVLREWLLEKVLDDDKPLRPEQIAGGHNIERAPREAGPIGGINKDYVKVLPLTNEARQNSQHIAADHPPRPEAGHLQVLAEDPEAARILLEKDHFGTAAAQGFNADGARPGVKIKKPDSMNRGPEDIKKRLPKVV